MLMTSSNSISITRALLLASAHRSIALHDQLGGKKRASSGPLSGPSSLAEILNAVGDA